MIGRDYTLEKWAVERRKGNEIIGSARGRVVVIKLKEKNSEAQESLSSGIYVPAASLPKRSHLGHVRSSDMLALWHRICLEMLQKALQWNGWSNRSTVALLTVMETDLERLPLKNACRCCKTLFLRPSIPSCKMPRSSFCMGIQRNKLKYVSRANMHKQTYFLFLMRRFMDIYDSMTINNIYFRDLFPNCIVSKH